MVTQNNKSGIYVEWEDVKRATYGATNPIFKKTRSLQEAMEFLRTKNIFNFYIHPKCRQTQQEKPDVIEGMKRLALKHEESPSSSNSSYSMHSPNISPYPGKIFLFEKIQDSLNSILIEELAVPGVTIHHDTHYIYPPIPCLKSSPQCTENKQRPEPACPCNTRYSIYKLVINMDQYKDFQYDSKSPVISLSTASQMGIIRKIYVHSYSQCEEFSPLLKQVMAEL